MTKSLPRFITLDGSIISKQLYGGDPRMTKTLMPERQRLVEMARLACGAAGLAGMVYRPSELLQRRVTRQVGISLTEKKSVKFNSAIVVFGELAN